MGEKLATLSDVVQFASMDQERWIRAILPQIRPDAGKLSALAIRKLSRYCRVGASKWADQFAGGFPITLGDGAEAHLPS